MGKNIIKQPAIRAALVASGNMRPAPASHKQQFNVTGNRAESQAAAIAARRKELGVKPVVLSRQLQHAMIASLAKVEDVL